MYLRNSLIIAVLCLSLPAARILAAEDPPQQTPAQLLEELWPGLTASDESARRTAEQQWQELCFQWAAPGLETERLAASQAMAQRLAASTTARARLWLLNQLERIGDADCTSAIAKQLDDADPLIRDAARRALANNPSAEAGARLMERLQAAPDVPTRIGLIHALGFRSDEASLPALANQLDQQDARVVAAAAQALGRVASGAAAERLASARKTATGPARLQIGDAYLRCADRALTAGRTAEAAAIYRELSAPEEPSRLAALKGLLRVSGEEAGAAVLEILVRDDAAARKVAIQHVTEISGNAIRPLAAGWSKLPPEGQISLLRALGARGEPAALPAVLAAVDSADEDVQIAALQALGGVGDVSVVPRLVQTLAAGGSAAAAARSALETMWAEGVDPQLVHSMQAVEDAGRRAQLIEILERRRASVAVPALLQEALHRDAGVRRRAMSALSQVAGAKDVPGMVQGLLHSQEGAERDEAEKAIATVCSRIAGRVAQAEPVLAVFRQSDAESQQALLAVLGRIGSAPALETVRSAMASSDGALRGAGVRGLCNWPDAEVAGDLLQLAGSESVSADRIRALRALARVAVLPGELSELEKLQLLQRGMQLADRREERDLILDRAREARTAETARFAAEYLGDPELAERACRTIVEIAHRRELREPNQAEFDQLLARVIQVTKDRALAERAKSYRSP